MKKIIVSLGILFLTPSVSHAALMGFLDGNRYDQSGEWKCLYLMDGNCYDKDQNILETRPVVKEQPVAPIPQSNPQTVYVPVYVPASVYAPPTTTNQPQPAMPTFNPFKGPPYKVTEYNNALENRKIFTVGIDLTREEKLSDSSYKIVCDTPTKQGKVFNTLPGVADSKKVYTQRVSGTNIDSNSGWGHYSCKFVFNLPEGTFESEAMEFDLVKEE